MRQTLLALILSLVTLRSQALAGPGSKAEKVALSKVTWVAVSKGAQKRILAHARRITQASGAQFVFLTGCRSPRTCAKAAKAKQAKVLLTARVEALGNTYLFRIQGRCLAKGRKVTKQKAACEVCSLPEAGRSLGKVLVKLARKTERQVCSPSGGKPSRKAPARSAAAAGPAGAPGQNTQARPAGGPTPGQGGSGKAAPILARPQSRPVSAKRTQRSSRSRLAANLKLSGWIVGGLAIGALAAGGVLLALDGKGTCSGGGECPEVYDFKAPGIATLAVGGAGLAAAVTMVVLGYRWSKGDERQAVSSKPRRWMFTAAPLPGGFALGAAGSF